MCKRGRGSATTPRKLDPWSYGALMDNDPPQFVTRAEVAEGCGNELIRIAGREAWFDELADS